MFCAASKVSNSQRKKIPSDYFPTVSINYELTQFSIHHHHKIEITSPVHVLIISFRVHSPNTLQFQKYITIIIIIVARVVREIVII
jgi:hypothetical protein